MNVKFQSILQTLVPFLMLGFAIALITGLLLMFFQILIWGFCIGAVLWMVALIKDFFFPAKTTDVKPSGRIIEHNDPK